MLESRAAAEAEARDISLEAAQKDVVAQKLEREMIDAAAQAEADRKVVANSSMPQEFCSLTVLLFVYSGGCGRTGSSRSLGRGEGTCCVKS